ncbi:MAG TPA: hypothetical protein PLD25_16530 [Chloroflexota bacterium]|nr:hypothetical protein [Chloroflexota bacterium]
MNLTQLLEQRKAEILSQATDVLARTHLTHYEEGDAAQIHGRLQTLYDLMAQSIKDRDLTLIVHYAETLAQERFAAGFDLYEVQTAFNVLEAAIWKQIIQDCPPPELAEALGLASTVHGAAKDALARQYVSLASQSRPASLNLLALFKGTDGF